MAHGDTHEAAAHSRALQLSSTDTGHVMPCARPSCPLWSGTLASTACRQQHPHPQLWLLKLSQDTACVPWRAGVAQSPGLRTTGPWRQSSSLRLPTSGPTDFCTSAFSGGEGLAPSTPRLPAGTRRLCLVSHPLCTGSPYPRLGSGHILAHGGGAEAREASGLHLKALDCIPSETVLRVLSRRSTEETAHADKTSTLTA